MRALVKQEAAPLGSGLNISPVITHNMKLEEYERGFEVLNKGEAMKVLLDVN